MSKRGYTLVEVMIVIALLSAMAAFTLPRFAALKAGQDSRDFTSALMHMGEEARLIAIQYNQTVQVRYDDSQLAFVFETLDPDTGTATERKTFAVPEASSVTEFTVDGDFSNSTDWRLEFYPDGTGFDGGIEVEDGSYIYHIVIEGKDGSAKKADGRLEEVGEQEWQAGELEQRV